MIDDVAGPADFGTRMRQLRLLAGVSLTQLAQSVNYSKGHLSNIESGARPASLNLARRVDHALRADGELVTMLPTRPALDPNATQPPTRSGSALDQVWSLRMTTDGGIEFHSRQPGIHDEGSVSWRTATPVAPGPGADLVARFQALLDEIRTMGQTLAPATIIPLAIPPANALRTAAHNGSAEPRAALRLAARYTEYIGWMAQESGDERAATWWTDQAVELANAGGSDEMSSYAFVRRAEIALYREDYLSVVDYARRAQAVTSSRRVRELGAQREAQGHALGGNERKTMAALERAAMLSNAPEGGAPSDGVILGSKARNTLSFVTAWSLHELGKSRETIAILTEELPQLPHGAHRIQARYGARLALALASHKDIEQACRVVMPVLAATDRVDSATARSDIRQLYRTLNRFRSHPRVSEIMPAIAHTLRNGRSERI